MTNSSSDDGLIAPVDARLAADLTELHAAPVPDLRFQRPVVAAPPQRRFGSRIAGIAAGLVAVAVAATATVVVAPGLVDDGAQSVDAAEILTRAGDVNQSQALAGGASYHLVAEIHDLDGMSTIETWYDADDRNRTEQRSSVESFALGQVVNGADTWLYLSHEDTVRAVHGDTSALGLAGVDLLGLSMSVGTNIVDTLDLNSTDTCQSAEQRGEDTIAGRDVYVIVVTPDPEKCPSEEMRLESEALIGSSVALWVDQQTFVTLKVEQKDIDGSTAFTYAATAIDVGTEFADSIFTYEAPAGVVIAEASSLSEASAALSPEE